MTPFKTPITNPCPAGPGSGLSRPCLRVAQRHDIPDFWRKLLEDAGHAYATTSDEGRSLSNAVSGQ